MSCWFNWVPLLYCSVLFIVTKLKMDQIRLLYLLHQGWGSCAPPSGWNWCRPLRGLGGMLCWWVCQSFLQWSSSPRVERRWHVRHWWLDRADPCCPDCSIKTRLILKNTLVKYQHWLFSFICYDWYCVMLRTVKEEREGNIVKWQNKWEKWQRTGVEEREGQIESVRSWRTKIK